MTETKTEREPTGLERFGHLEDKIYKVVEAFKTVRQENEGLRAEIQTLKTENENLQVTQLEAQEALATLHKEREQLRERVEKALNLLATLETR